ncbi:MAG: N-acetylornithine carbamoyltransferase [Acidobacteriota bacterium]|nr:N-acetylornithine carbamoyltransferase [Acidobacteriota bacterium]
MISVSSRHFLSTLDLPVEEVRALVDHALALKSGRVRAALDRRLAALIFFNPSVRTRVSCEAAMVRFGGQALTINPGKDTWNFEHREGIVMDGDTQEHVRELAPVLSRMCDVVGIRKSELITRGSERAQVTGTYRELAKDAFMRRFAEFSEVPVVNLESNAFHPLQGLADMATMVERLRDPSGKKYVLTWAWHPKSLPVATPHSQLLSAADLGMNVTLLHPAGWGLDPEVVEAARSRAASLGGSLDETDDVEAAYDGAHVVCAKAWGSLDYYGRFDEEARDKAPLRERWIVDERKMSLTDEAFFMHCLPVRRNVVVSDGVLDSGRSAVIDEAENRVWTAAAVLGALAGRTGS